VHPEVMLYTTDVMHDGRRFHLEVPRIHIPKCRACGNLVFSHSVDDEVFRALRQQAWLLAPEQIKEARMALGLKSKELAERLGVAAETISRWERGGLIQSRAMDNLLRLYFGFPVVREALRGAEQDPYPGTTAVLQDPVSPAKDPLPGPPPNRIPRFRTSKAQEAAAQRKHDDCFRSEWLLEPNPN
jgi:putative zinc finger/helix-turn-helix YgiT family protein